MNHYCCFLVEEFLHLLDLTPEQHRMQVVTNHCGLTISHYLKPTIVDL